ncbi:MAG: hypothetical protein R2932_12815 [Caldilineaceae bacterium]
MPEKYNLKYVFSNDNFYDPLLFFYGWHRIGPLENDIIVWEREDIPVLPEVLPRREVPLYHRVMFGILPLAALFAAIVATTSDHWMLPLRLLAELLGITGVLAHWSRRQRLFWGTIQRWWQRWLWQPLDSRLLAVTVLPIDTEPSPPPWQHRIQHLWQQARRHPRAISAQQRHRHLLILVGAILLLITITVSWSRWYNHRPEAVIQGYYDDIDFKRFNAAYLRLNPQTRPTFDDFMLNLSVQGDCWRRTANWIHWPQRQLLMSPPIGKLW